MKPLVVLILLIGLFIGGSILLLFNNSSEEAPLDVIPSTAQTSEPEVTAPSESEVALSDLIQIDSPVSGATVGNPVSVSGQARGYWFFEATAPVVVVNWDGLIIGEGYVTANGEWMTEELVPFTGTIEYDLAPETPYTRGWVIFQRSNPSGLPENDAAVEIPVELSF